MSRVSLPKRLAEADVVFQKTQDGGVEQNLSFGFLQAFEFIEGDFALQQFGLADRAQLARIFIRQQHDGRGDVHQQFGREQDVLLARGIVQDGDIAVRFQMSRPRSSSRHR